MRDKPKFNFKHRLRDCWKLLRLSRRRLKSKIINQSFNIYWLIKKLMWGCIEIKVIINLTNMKILMLVVFFLKIWQKMELRNSLWAVSLLIKGHALQLNLKSVTKVNRFLWTHWLNWLITNATTISIGREQFVYLVYSKTLINWPNSTVRVWRKNLRRRRRIQI